LSVERFVEIFGPLKPHFIHHPKTAALIRDVVAELGGDLNTSETGLKASISGS
jgi:hypothetical protein